MSLRFKVVYEVECDVSAESAEHAREVAAREHFHISVYSGSYSIESRRTRVASVGDSSTPESGNEEGRG